MSRLLAAISFSFVLGLPAVAAAEGFSDAMKTPSVAEKVAALAADLPDEEKDWVTWVTESGGVEGPADDVTIAGESWKRYYTCRAHMCDQQAIYMMVSAEGDVFLRLLGSDVAGGTKFLGDPPAPVKAALWAQ